MINRQEEVCSDPEDGRIEPCEARRLPYITPRLELLGDVRDLTLGGSPGTGDSSQPFLQNPPHG